jgi:hypothetical protein
VTRYGAKEEMQNAWSLRGFKNTPVEDIRLKDCNFENASKPNVTENVENLKLENVKVNGKVW